MSPSSQSELHKALCDELRMLIKDGRAQKKRESKKKAVINDAPLEVEQKVSGEAGA